MDEASGTHHPPTIILLTYCIFPHTAYSTHTYTTFAQVWIWLSLGSHCLCTYSLCIKCVYENNNNNHQCTFHGCMSMTFTSTQGRSTSTGTKIETNKMRQQIVWIAWKMYGSVVWWKHIYRYKKIVCWDCDKVQIGVGREESNTMESKRFSGLGTTAANGWGWLKTDIVLHLVETHSTSFARLHAGNLTRMPLCQSKKINKTKNKKDVQMCNTDLAYATCISKRYGRRKRKYICGMDKENNQMLSMKRNEQQANHSISVYMDSIGIEGRLQSNATNAPLHIFLGQSSIGCWWKRGGRGQYRLTMIAACTMFHVLLPCFVL